MEFRIIKASDGEYKERREINTVEDLKKLAEEHPTEQGKPEALVLLFNGWSGKGDPMIMIYDDYIE